MSENGSSEASETPVVRAKAWHARYGYVSNYALQGKTFTLHPLNPTGGYYPPPCGKRDVQLVRRINLNLEAARDCKACTRRLLALDTSGSAAAEKDPS